MGLFTRRRRSTPPPPAEPPTSTHTENSSDLPTACLNCHVPFPDTDAKYCASCGQKNQSSYITFRQVIADFAESFFNLDARLWRTLGLMFLPGRLTLEYVKGRRRDFLNPLRLFVLTAILNFAALSFVLREEINDLQDLDPFSSERFERPLIDSLLAIRHDFAASYGERSKEVAALDSLHTRMISDVVNLKDSIPWSKIKIGSQNAVCGDIATVDYLRLSRDSLQRKYHIDGFVERMIFWRAMKIMDKGAHAYSKVLLGNLLWVTLLTIPLIAIMMKVLYVRRKHYWVEHLIFWVHVHCLTFSVSAVGLMMRVWTDSVAFLWISVVINLIILWLAMKRYYGQGFIKTTVKFYLAGWTYWLIWWILFFWNLLITVFIF